MSTPKPARQPDHTLISVNNAFEINYLQQRLGVSKQDVLTAIAAVGNGRREVVAYLEKLKKRSAATSLM